MKLHTTEKSYNELHDLLHRTRSSTKYVEVDKKVLFDLLRDHANMAHALKIGSFAEESKNE